MKTKLITKIVVLTFAFGIFSGCSYDYEDNTDVYVTEYETSSEAETTEDISADLIVYGSGVLATPENIDELIKEAQQ